MEVLFEDNHIIAVNKASGDLVQGDQTGDPILPDKIKAYLKKKYNKAGNVFLGVVHRLDRPVTGVVMFARTSKALPRLVKLFRDRDLDKVYWAMVTNRPEAESGHLVNFLLKDTVKNKAKVMGKLKGDAKLAELDYKLIGRMQEYYLLEVRPYTGRPHQIRAQLAEMGCPIAGDYKYGYPRRFKDGSIGLHARQLIFTHPVTKEEVRITASLPKTGKWSVFEGF